MVTSITQMSDQKERPTIGVLRITASTPACVGCYEFGQGEVIALAVVRAAMATDRCPTDIIPSRDTKRPLSLSLSLSPPLPFVVSPTY